MTRRMNLFVTACLAAVCAVGIAGEPDRADGAVTAAADQPKTDVSPFTRPRIAPADLRQRLDRDDPDLLVLDVRTTEEFAAGHVPGARNVPHDQVVGRIAELAAMKDREVVVYCRSGRRAAMAAQELRNAGFTRLRHLEGDYPGWETSTQPAEGVPDK